MATMVTERRAMASLATEIAALAGMGRAELAAKFEELVGRPSRTHNLASLRKRLAWELQARAEGGLSQRALARIEELAPLAPARWRRPNGAVEPPAKAARDPRLPPVGTVLTKEHGGREHKVTILEDGFEYHGKRYGSLSAVARRISGQAWNPYYFFRLARRPSKAKEAS